MLEQLYMRSWAKVLTFGTSAFIVGARIIIALLLSEHEAL